MLAQAGGDARYKMALCTWQDSSIVWLHDGCFHCFAIVENNVLVPGYSQQLSVSPTPGSTKQTNGHSEKGVFSQIC